jgi:hypothetical protein
VLADQLATLSGEPRARFEALIEGVTALIRSGKFSQAFRYAELIAEGERLREAQRREQAEAVRLQRALDAARKKVGEELRSGAPSLAPELTARLSRALRAAGDHAAIDAVAEEVRQSVAAAQAVQERRREREIHRTRSRIERSASRAAQSDGAESWQDVLRRLQEEMTAGSSSS